MFHAEYLQFALYFWDMVVQIIIRLMNLVDILQTFLKEDLKYPASLPSLHKALYKVEKLIESMLLEKCSKVPNLVQGETCAADLPLITGS